MPVAWTVPASALTECLGSGAALFSCLLSPDKLCQALWVSLVSTRILVSEQNQTQVWALADVPKVPGNLDPSNPQSPASPEDPTQKAVKCVIVP